MRPSLYASHHPLGEFVVDDPQEWKSLSSVGLFVQVEYVRDLVQRFVNGERGITLETAGKLAAYWGLSLLPETDAMSKRDA